MSSQTTQDQNRQESLSNLGVVDYLVLAVYFVIVIATGLYSSLKNRGSVGGYFMAGQNMNWILVGLSLYASNIGSGHFVGLAGSAASSGIAIAAFELHAVYTLTLLGWMFAPVYKAAGVFTLPEYLYKRFGGRRIRIYLAVLSLFLYVFTKISADLFSGALFLTQAVPSMSIYLSVTILISVAALCTITGGLTAVIWTDAIQTVVMIVGAIVLMGLSFKQIGGYENVQNLFPKAVADTLIANQDNASYAYKDCGRPDRYYFNIMRPHDDPALPWTGLVFGLTVSAVWYWCSDQVIVQRVLAAKNMVHVKLSCVLASYLKVSPLFLIVFPGMIARVLFPNKLACNEPARCQEICGSRSGCSNIAYPTLVLEIMPTGLRGLLLSVMMSALISSLTSVFNSTATIFTMDVWTYLRSRASDMELMIVGRLCVLILVAVSVAWIPVIQGASELFHYIQNITSFLAPPVCAVFVLAVFWNRCTEAGVFWGLMFGLVVGMTRFIWQFFFHPNAVCGETDSSWPRSPLIDNLHYLNFGAVLFSLVVTVTVIISFAKPPPPKKSYMGMTYSTRYLPGKLGKCFKSRLGLEESFQDVGTKKADRQKRQQQQQQQEQTYMQTLLAGRTFSELPLRMKLFLWLCGIEGMATERRAAQGEATPPRQVTDRSVWEPVQMSYLLHCNGLLALGIITLIWAYFG